jgi:protein TonB
LDHLNEATVSQSNAISRDVIIPASEAGDVFEINIASRPVPIWIEYAAMRDLHRDAALAGECLGLLLGSLTPEALCIRCCEVNRPEGPAKQGFRRFHDDLRELINARLENPLQGVEHLAGFFRTQAGGRPEMLESDHEIAKRYFRGAGSLFLLVQTHADRPWSAALFELNGGRSPKAPTLEFFFDEYLLRNGYLTDTMPQPAQRRLPPPDRPRRSSHRYRGLVLSTLVALVLLGGGGYKWYTSRDRSEPAVPASAVAGPLGLKVVSSDKDFEISWDRQSPVVTQSSGGTLTIRDGGLTRTVLIAPAQLREGRIQYTPLFDDLNFRLEISQGARTVAESIQILSPSNRSWQGLLPDLPSDSVLQNSLSAGKTQPPAQPANISPKPTVPAAPARTAGKAFIPPIANATGAGPAAPALDAPPPVSDVPANPGPTLTIPTASLIGRPPVAPPAASAAARPSLTTLAPAASSGAVAIEQVAPVTSQDLRNALNASPGQTVVLVKVAIDASGKVKSAEVASVSRKSPADFYIHAAALEAARSWKFKPATLNGKSVPSESTIQFKFQ